MLDSFNTEAKIKGKKKKAEKCKYSPRRKRKIEGDKAEIFWKSNRNCQGRTSIKNGKGTERVWWSADKLEEPQKWRI